MLEVVLKKRKEFLEKYLSIPLTLPITDESMKRVCEVLSRVGYKTLESCEGHGETLPKVFLKCDSPYHLRHLTRILRGESDEKNFIWDLCTYTPDVFVNPNHPLQYIMSPNLSYTNASPQDPIYFEKMIDDLDLIGISVLRYFTSVNLQNLERYRKKIDFRVRNFKNPKFS